MVNEGTNQYESVRVATWEIFERIDSTRSRNRVDRWGRGDLTQIASTASLQRLPGNFIFLYLFMLAVARSNGNCWRQTITSRSPRKILFQFRVCTYVSSVSRTDPKARNWRGEWYRTDRRSKASPSRLTGRNRVASYPGLPGFLADRTWGLKCGFAGQSQPLFADTISRYFDM